MIDYTMLWFSPRRMREQHGNLLDWNPEHTDLVREAIAVPVN